MLPSPPILLLLLLLVLLSLSIITRGINPPATISLLVYFYYHGASTLGSLIHSCHGRWHQDIFHCALQGTRILAAHGVVYYAGGEGAATLRSFSSRRRNPPGPGGRLSAEIMEQRIRELDLVEKARELEGARAAPDGTCLSPLREMEDAMAFSSAAYACPVTGFRYGNGWFSYTDGARVKIWCTALCRADRAGCCEFGEQIGHDIVGMTHRHGMTGSLVWWNEIGTREVAKCRVVRLKPAE